MVTSYPVISGDHNKPKEGSLLNNQAVVTNICIFIPKIGEMTQLLTNIFQMG